MTQGHQTTYIAPTKHTVSRYYVLYIWTCSACSLKPLYLCSRLPCFLLHQLQQHVVVGPTFYVKQLQLIKEIHPHLDSSMETFAHCNSFFVSSIKAISTEKFVWMEEDMGDVQTVAGSIGWGHSTSRRDSPGESSSLTRCPQAKRHNCTCIESLPRQRSYTWSQNHQMTSPFYRGTGEGRWSQAGK